MAFLLSCGASAGHFGTGHGRATDELSTGSEHPPAKPAQGHRRPQRSPGFHAEVECENSASLLSVVLRSEAIGIVGAYSDALHQAKGELVCLRIEGLADDLEELYTRYGIVSRAGYRLSPLAEAMIEQIKAVDAVDEEVCSLDRLAV